MTTARVIQVSPNEAFHERRQFRRLAIAVQTELRVKGNEVPIRVETADISLGGCYVEMALTIDVGLPLNIVLWLGHDKLVLEGKVATRHPQFGNGIEFTGIPKDSRDKLQRFIESAAASGQEHVSRGGRFDL